MSASITIGSLSLASDGKTITGTLSGGSGSGYSPASGVTGITIRTTTNSGGRYSNSSVTISGTTITIVTVALVSSDDTVVLDCVVGSNITDSGANTLTGQTSVAVTNNSTKAATRYLSSNAAVKYYGRFSGANPTYQQFVDTTASEAVFVVNGTDASAMVLNSTATWKVSVDGGAFAAPSVVYSPNGNQIIMLPLFSGLSAGDHTVSLKQAANNAYLIAANSIQVFGGTGAIRAPGYADGQGYGQYVQFLGGAAYVDPGSWLSGAEYSTPHNLNGSVTPGWADCSARVKGRGDKLWLWLNSGGNNLVVEIDGVIQTPFAVSPNGGTWGWQLVASGLDPSNDHVYSIRTYFGGHVQYIDAVMFSGSTAAVGAFPLAVQPGLGGYGDSITIAAGTNSNVGFLDTLAKANGFTTYNRGYNGTLVTGAGASAGQIRTADITSITPELSKCTVLYGTNDLTASGNGSVPTSAFGTAYRTMLTALVNGTVNTKFYIVGITPRTGYSSATIAAWNGSGDGVLGSVAAVKLALPASASRLIFIDPAPWHLNGLSGSDYTTNYIDGLHPNALGHAIIKNGLTDYISASTVRIADGTISISTFSSALTQLLTRRITIAGTTNPITADTYQVFDFYNDTVCYKSTTLGIPIYIWNNGDGYTISATVGVNGSSYFTTASGGSANSAYAAQGSATGTPVATAHGNAVLSGFQPDQAWMASNSAQTGDSFARIGAAGAGLTALGDSRISNLDASVSSRLATSGYTSPPSAAANASATATQIATDHGSGSYIRNTEPDNADIAATQALAAGASGFVAIKSAVGLTASELNATANKNTVVTAIPTADQNATTLLDKALSGHTTSGTTGGALNAISGASGSGNGLYPINQDGGSGLAGADIGIYLPHTAGSSVGSSTGVLKFTSNGSAAIAGLTIRAYLVSAYDAGVRSANPPTTTTHTDGRWVSSLSLDSGTWYLIVDTVNDGWQPYQVKIVVP